VSDNYEEMVAEMADTIATLRRELEEARMTPAERAVIAAAVKTIKSFGLRFGWLKGSQMDKLSRTVARLLSERRGKGK